MNTPFPGMDPYLEHPAIWEGVHARLVVAIANQLQPRLDPRYVTSVEERVFIEGPQQRIPDAWNPTGKGGGMVTALGGVAAAVEADRDTAVVVEVAELDVHQKRLEILDAYNDLRLVTVIEVLSPTNKRPGPGRDAYATKQQEGLERECHLVEIAPVTRGPAGTEIPPWKLDQLRPFEYVVCVSRWPWRNRFELYPRRLEESLPRLGVPLVNPDPDVALDVQAALEQVYVEGRYVRRPAIRRALPTAPERRAAAMGELVLERLPDRGT